MSELSDVAAKQSAIDVRLDRLEEQVDGLLAVREALVALVNAHDDETLTEEDWGQARVALGRRREFDAWMEANCSCGYNINASQAHHTVHCPCYDGN